MMNLLIALVLASNLPTNPGDYWVWVDQAEARRWVREHPQVHLCTRRVPDGYATFACERKSHGR